MKQLITLAVIAFSFIFSDAFVAYAQNRGGVVSASSMVVTRTRIKKQRDIRWQNNIEAAVTEGHYDAAYAGGWRFDNFLFLGFGSGVQVYEHVIPDLDYQGLRDFYNKNANDGHYYCPSRIAVPVYAQMKLYFMKTKVSPYLSASGGFLLQGNLYEDGDRLYKEGINGTGYADITFGADFKLKNNKSLSLGLYFPITGEMAGIGYSYMKGNGGYKLTFSF